MTKIRSLLLLVLFLSPTLLFPLRAEAAPDPSLAGGSGSPASVFLGSPVSYSILVKNIGDQTTGAITLQYSYSSEVNFSSSNSSVTCGSSSPTRVTCGMTSSLAARETRFITVTVTPTERGDLNCVVQLSTTGEDSNPSNNTRGISGVEVREWSVETVFGQDPWEEGDAPPEAGEFAQVALGLNEIPFLSHYLALPDTDLYFHRRQASVWLEEMVSQSDDAGRNSRFAISTTAGGEDRLHFIFTRSGAGGETPLRYVQTDSSGQTLLTQDIRQAGNNNFRALALNSTGLPQISHRKQTAIGIDCYNTDASSTTSVMTTGLLMHHWYNGTSWACAQVTNGAISGPHDMTIAGDGRGHSAYIFESAGITHLGYRRSAVPTDPGGVTLWRAGAGRFVKNRALTGDPTPTDVHLAIATDESNRAHICLYDPVGRQLLYFLPAAADGALPVGTTVDGTAASYDAVADPTDVGQFCDITVRGGVIHISYYDAQNNALKYAWKTLSGTVWSKTIVDDAADPSDVGQYSSLAVDSKGFIHIGYYDVLNKDAKYAVIAGCGNWRVDSGETCDDGNIIAGDGCSATCQTEPSCGNGTCDAGESNASCPADCPASCGNGTCETGETTTSCLADCPASCGNGTCDAGESNASCPADCLASCGNGTCETGEDSTTCAPDCGTTCGNGTCEAAENNATCPADCQPRCGNSVCEAGENNQNCSQDCVATCGNAACEVTETNSTCPADCAAVCGNQICEGGENNQNCSQDCGVSCGDSICGAGETNLTCPRDCPAVCGNGVQEGTEQCDDGNTTAGDRCSATCQTEAQGAVCGNNTKEGDEQCDDGNMNTGDGCSATCRTEAPAPPVPPGGDITSPPESAPIVPPPTGRPTRGGGCSLIKEDL